MYVVSLIFIIMKEMNSDKQKLKSVLNLVISVLKSGFTDLDCGGGGDFKTAGGLRSKR